jgi:hypothetical protein
MMPAANMGILLQLSNPSSYCAKCAIQNLVQKRLSGQTLTAGGHGALLGRWWISNGGQKRLSGKTLNTWPTSLFLVAMVGLGPGSKPLSG